MDNPTEEQIKEFWEWCGFTIEPDPTYPDWEVLKAPDGRHIIGSKRILPNHFPEPDPNNLFRYAMPKLWAELNKAGKFYKFDRLWEDIKRALLLAANPAEALFWAIWQALKEGMENG